MIIKGDYKWSNIFTGSSTNVCAIIVFLYATFIDYDRRLQPQTYCPCFHGLDVRDLIWFVCDLITFVYAFFNNICVVVSNAMQFDYLHPFYRQLGNKFVLPSVASCTNVRILPTIRVPRNIVQWCTLTLLDWTLFETNILYKYDMVNYATHFC